MSDRVAFFGTRAWQGIGNVPAARYLCGYCESVVGSDLGFQAVARGSNQVDRFARVCPLCGGLTIFGFEGEAIPAPLPGDGVAGLPPLVGAIYGEARAALAAGAPSGAALLFRTILMHVACELGAKPGLAFVDYVNFLESNHHVPPSAKAWVDHIRKQGNVLAHELTTTSRKDADELLVFVEMLLRLAFEFPARMKAKAP